MSGCDEPTARPAGSSRKSASGASAELTPGGISAYQLEAALRVLRRKVGDRRLFAVAMVIKFAALCRESLCYEGIIRRCLPVHPACSSMIERSITQPYLSKQ